MTAADGRDRFAALAASALDVTAVRFVDGPRADALRKIGVTTVDGLLRHYPFRYLDLSATESLARVRVDADATVVGTVHEVRVKKPRPRLTITEVALTDGTGTLLGVWFNQPYVQQRFMVGERVAFAGRVQLDYGMKQIRNPFVEKLADDSGPEGLARILPVHRATESLSTNWIRRLVTEALDAYGDVPDPLPASVRRARGLLPLAAALRAIHFPASSDDLAAARRRLAYEELLDVRLGMLVRRHEMVDELDGTAHVTDGPAVAALRAVLPFRLTGDQEDAVRGILADMARPRPMNRMLLGDVGSGKTIVAGFALAAAADTGSQAAMMAPTEVLATQYALKLAPLLEAAGVRTALLTGSTKAAERRAVLEAIAVGDVQAVFGTHALLEECVAFRDLTLAIVDEQHRFGVSQRLGLRAKGRAADLLVMTATPIPRSLALTLYGDLDSSVVRERPQGRSPGEHITTRVVPSSGREDAYEAVRAAVRDGHQAYVVCAMVDESDVTEAKAAVREAERLKERVFPRLRVGLLTGRMKAADKAAVMESFRAGTIDVLVATTVIEVGIDVPNATVMIVEDAERFGLSQLHQLRGRIGRGEEPGTFLLFADARTDEGRKRMQAIATLTDGFELAEADLELRGEGQMLGERQSGMPE
ncbi:MAG: ATP-dependent DNA helicase RecG, partial [Actinobacteria bacterium]